MPFSRAPRRTLPPGAGSNTVSSTTRSRPSAPKAEAAPTDARTYSRSGERETGFPRCASPKRAAQKPADRKPSSEHAAVPTGVASARTPGEPPKEPTMSEPQLRQARREPTPGAVRFDAEA